MEADAARRVLRDWIRKARSPQSTAASTPIRVKGSNLAAFALSQSLERSRTRRSPADDGVFNPKELPPV